MAFQSGIKSQVVYPNNTSVNLRYGDLGRLTGIINRKPDSSVLSTYSYGYDYNQATGSYSMKGYRTSMTNLSAQVEKYYFDNLYQLARVDYGNGDMHQWNYDDIGNRVQQTVTPFGQSPIVTNYTYYQNSQNRNSQLLASDGTNSYTWDNNGNLLTKGSTNYTWDFDDRLTGISGGSVSAAYAYDYQGERIKKTVGGVETGYLYQGEDIIKETSGGTVTDYLHGIGIDDPVYLDRSGAKSYYFGDGLGSIREMTDATGTGQNSYSYGAWGELRASSATVANSYGYTGREFAEEGMYFYRARYLDPGLGRFISEDPIGLNLNIITEDPADIELNRYRYVKNDSINKTDSFGLLFLSISRFACGTVIMRHYYIKMRKKNWIGADGYYHCMGSCVTSKTCGPDVSYYLGVLREISDRTRGKGDDKERDMKNNARGITCPPKVSCHERCKSLAPPGMPFD